jgi:4-hydroxy-tetrahydrodipicolinate synthase
MTAGVAGFLVPAMAAEVDQLTDDERIDIVKTVLDEVDHRVPVIGGASASSQEGRLRHARKLIELGCDGILMYIPYHDDQQYLREVREIATLEPGFLMLQDWDPHGFGVPVPVIQQLFYEIECFRSLKIEVVPAGAKYTQVLEATRGHLHVTGGWAVMQMIEALDRGVHALMPTGMSEIYTTIYTLYHEGQREAARELFEQVLPVLAFSNQHLDISIQFFKRLMFTQGLYATPNVRNPQFPFDTYHEQIADDLIKLVQKLTATLQP